MPVLRLWITQPNNMKGTLIDKEHRNPGVRSAPKIRPFRLQRGLARHKQSQVLLVEQSCFISDDVGGPLCGHGAPGSPILYAALHGPAAPEVIQLDHSL